jgi:hypothetical protein
MYRRRRLWRSGAVAFLGAQFLLPILAQAPRLSLEEQGRFLLNAKIQRTRELSEGITNSVRATLSDGTLTHDAHVQTIDESKTSFQSAMGTELNFRDSYKFNIAAYRLDQMLGLGMTPISVERRVGGKTGAITWWVDDAVMTEKVRFQQKKEPPDLDRWNRQMYIVRVFDQLIFNTDRNLGNLVITKDWDIWMIDHTRAFRLYTTLRDESNLEKIDRLLLENLRKLDEPGLTRAMARYLSKKEIQGLLARRDRIVQFFDRAIAEKGEQAVLYDYLAARQVHVQAQAR